ncbi:2'-5' RNA ligase [Okibacterium sp. HSC-33S16]|uniref:2'-5' RNA ligase family protein n=1 Tax=Okibacterium sp. HSC-33S16 TaxID=2910965 RepID=UPI00209FE3B6|nr:2'-5' RNA ligase family protein [Okibacterium sp. HSC-33S16]MCP2031240.1 2'-5' RNA ligase [Okibacterium sp. HSC-33S16]
MSRVVAVLPLAPLTVGDSFLVSAWPLHITVVPPFATEASVPQLAAALDAAIGDEPEFTVVATGDDLFGRRHNIPVTLIAENRRLIALRARLIRAMRPLASHADDRAFSGPEFRPHVTVKGANRVQEGDELHLRQIALVDMAPRQSPTGRTVLAAIPLGRTD